MSDPTTEVLDAREAELCTAIAEIEESELKLNVRQRAFIQQLLIDNNATQAAIRAGYSPAAASEHSSRLLSNAKFRALVEKARAERNARVNVTQEHVLQEMALLANATLEHYYIDDDGYVKTTPDAPEGAMRAIQSIKRRKTVKEDPAGNITITYDVEIKLWDKPGSLKLMGRHVGLFPNRVEVTGKGGQPIELAALTNDALKARALELAQLAETIEADKNSDE